MGTWPPLIEKPRIEYLERERRDRLTQHHVRLEIAPGRTTEDAYLLLPHGDGPFPTFSAELTERLPDPGNPRNPWQGGLRCGWLDLPLLRYAAEVAGPLDGIVVNHLDQLADGECLVSEAYRGAMPSPSPVANLSWQSRLTREVRAAEPLLSPATPDGIVRAVGEIAPVAITGRGPTHREREFNELRWRKRRGS